MGARLRQVIQSVGAKLQQFIRWFTLDRILALVGTAAGVLAIYYETKLHNSVEEIISALPTRYVSRFPLNLDDAKQVISAAEHDDELIILTDFLGYGYYSCPSKFDEYLKAIKNASEKARVRILIYGKQEAGKVLDTQLSFADYQNVLKNSDHYKNATEGACLADDLGLRQKRFWYFINLHKLTQPELTQAGYEQFRKDLHQVQKRYCHQLDASTIQIRTIKEHPKPDGREDQNKEAAASQTIFFWMRKDKEVVFAYPNIGIGKGFTFKSSDHNLESVFLDQFNHLWGDDNNKDSKKDAEPVDCDSFFNGGLPVGPSANEAVKVSTNNVRIR